MGVSSIPVVLLVLCAAKYAQAQQESKLAGGTQQNNFYGTVMTFDPKDTYANGSLMVVLRHKTAFESCTFSDIWECVNGYDCGKVTQQEVNPVHHNIDWCQQETVSTRLVPINTFFWMETKGGNWTNNTNSIVNWEAYTLMNLLTRPDTGKANRSPQTNIIPSLRVPSNCVRNFNLVAFDPDGDQVACNTYKTLPPFLTTTNCTLSFAATDSSNEGIYVVQLYMYDYPHKPMTLTDNNGVQYNISASFGFSSLPIQFVLKVDGAVASCTEGQYLPRFLPPTPANRAQLYAPVGHTLEITINTVATKSTVSELLFSGPHNINLTGSEPGQFMLRWTPSQSEDGEHHPVCFVAQTNGAAPYQSELRCVIVSVSNAPTTTSTNGTPSPVKPCESLFCGGPNTTRFSYFTYILTLVLILYSLID